VENTIVMHEKIIPLPPCWPLPSPLVLFLREMSIWESFGMGMGRDPALVPALEE